MFPPIFFLFLTLPALFLPRRDLPLGKNLSWGGTHPSSEIDLRARFGPSGRSFPSRRSDRAIWRAFAPLWELALSLRGFHLYFPLDIVFFPLADGAYSSEARLYPLLDRARREKARSV